MFPENVLLVPLIRPFSIVLVNLAFNATRNSRVKSKNAKIMPDFFKKMPLEFQKMLCFISNKTYKLLHYMLISTTGDT